MFCAGTQRKIWNELWYNGPMSAPDLVKALKAPMWLVCLALFLLERRASVVSWAMRPTPEQVEALPGRPATVWRMYAAISNV